MKIFFMILCFFALVGCSQKIDEKQTVEMDHAGEKVLLSEEEERLLCDLYVDEERIREGYLYDYQEKSLEQIRFGIKYLEETYPDKNFELLVLHPKSKVNMVTTISFMEEGNTGDEYTLIIESDGNGWTAKDDYDGGNND